MDFDFTLELERLTLEQAALWTVAYADVFDYPLTGEEIHWYLWGIPAGTDEVRGVLRSATYSKDHLSYVPCEDVEDDGAGRGYYTLPGRESIVALRHRRERVAKPLWEKAWRYGRLIAHLPFVRMVALTGSLAAGNVEPGADIDYLVVTQRGRLWVCRAAVIALSLWAARRGDVICPNYFLAENALVFGERNLYTAREFTQMIPLYGLGAYRRMRARNLWVRQYLPNAQGLPLLSEKVYGREGRKCLTASGEGVIKRAAEVALQTQPGQWLEGWEMRRKLRKFRSRLANHPESNFSADCCKGHFNDHMTRTLETFAGRLQRIEGVGQHERVAIRHVEVEADPVALSIV